MRYLELPGVPPGSSAKLSELGFGCAALLGRASRKQSLAALAAAVDSGITFFDTARSYGYGASEGLLGEVFAHRRDQFVLCTKFGILPAPNNWKQKIKPLARAVVNAFPGLRKAAQRQAASQFTGGQFTVAALQSSFETSLRELRTDYVDILLMHAAPETVLADNALLDAMAALVEAGKVRVAGISADLPVIEKFFAQRPPQLQTAQFALNLSLMPFATQTAAQTVPNSDLLLVANHPFGGPGGNAAARILTLRDSPTLPQSLKEKLDTSDPQLLPEVVLNMILRGTGVRAVIPAMMQPRHIRSNVQAVESCRFTSEELAQLRAVLARNHPS
jgi:aryl-alcohol dehydrogenase-like predicted oxidoreductase